MGPDDACLQGNHLDFSHCGCDLLCDYCAASAGCLACIIPRECISCIDFCPYLSGDLRLPYAHQSLAPCRLRFALARSRSRMYSLVQPKRRPGCGVLEEKLT